MGYVKNSSNIGEAFLKSLAIGGIGAGISLIVTYPMNKSNNFLICPNCEKVFSRHENNHLCDVCKSTKLVPLKDFFESKLKKT